MAGQSIRGPAGSVFSVAQQLLGERDDLEPIVCGGEPDKDMHEFQPLRSQRRIRIGCARMIGPGEGCHVIPLVKRHKQSSVVKNAHAQRT